MARPAFFRHAAIAVSPWLSTLGVTTLPVTDGAGALVLVDAVPELLALPEELELQATSGSAASASVAKATAPPVDGPERRDEITAHSSAGEGLALVYPARTRP